MYAYAQIILPLAIGDTFTYGIPLEMQEQISVGIRVEVKFGKKVYAGIVAELHNHKPDQYQVQPIKSLIDITPIVSNVQLKLWAWIAQYYMCHIGEVMAAVLPNYLKLSSETSIVLNQLATVDDKQLNDAEYLILEALQIRGQITLDEAEAIIAPVPIRKTLAGLLNQSYVLAFETLQDAYKPKTEDVICLSQAYTSNEAQQKLFNDLEKAPKQLHLVLHYLNLKDSDGYARKKEVLTQSGATSAQLQSLINKGVFEVYKFNIDRVVLKADKQYAEFTLSPQQQQVLTDLTQNLPKQTCVLYGITGSGKTNVHIKLIEQYIQQGKQVLYLVPEIALTTQLINKLYSYFGNDIGVYHSKYSNNERVETWQNVRSGKIKVLIGARSSLFLPFENLGLIIIDEEHDASYKQYDTAPRYQARDTALVLSKLSQCHILLSSATPSIETFYNCQQNKYKLITLSERYGKARLPQILIVDNKIIQGQPRQSQLLHDTLIGAIKTTLQQKKQVILFQNRRGFAPYLFCADCGWNAHCRNCDVSITYHRATDKLHCHYCGATTPVMKLCPQCKSARLYFKNYGTERVQEEVQRVFPTAVLDRLDTDAARTKNRYKEIVSNVEKNKTQILVGTQMLAKGLDFEHVQLVGVVSADSLFSFPEYRVSERAFQMLSQVSGRAGRQDDGALVLIQTTNTANPYLQFVVDNNYIGFFNTELNYRREFEYPPFTRLIKITVAHRMQAAAKESIQYIAQQLLSSKTFKVLGPTEPPVSKRNNMYYEEVLVKCANDTKVIKYAKECIALAIQRATSRKGRSTLKVIVDVDP